MRIVFVAAECEPWAKVGGLGDVVDALARSLGRVAGVAAEPVEVFLPGYRLVPVPGGGVSSLVVRVPDPRAPGGMSAMAVRSFDADGYRLRLVDHPPAFDRAGVYGDGPLEYPDNAWRFGLLAAAALAARRAEGRPLDVLAAHDWHACPAVLQRDIVHRDDPLVAGAAAVLTIHNPAYRGWVPRDLVADLGLGADPPAGDGWGVDLLLEGVRRADALNTVSPTFAREMRTPEGGAGLDGELRARGDAFGGILNGLDTRLWDPATDAVLAARYGPGAMAGKAACRADLCSRVGFDGDDPGPVLGLVGRLDPQKGFDLVAAAAPALLESGARIVALGDGDPDHVAGMRTVQAAAPGRVAMVERFDRDLARRIYAGADLFLMPSRFEPCGQGQMIAMRYGTPPVARRTGGLADTIVDLDDDPAGGTGFLFDEPTADALVAACRRAIAARDDDGSPWRDLVARAMAVDRSWERSSAPAYAALYRRAIEARRAALGSGQGS